MLEARKAERTSVKEARRVAMEASRQDTGNLTGSKSINTIPAFWDAFNAGYNGKLRINCS